MGDVIDRGMTAASPRSSGSDPLRIAELPAGAAGGLIGITFCPGKCGASIHGPAWQRDLAIDLDAIRAWRARAVVTLIEQHEMTLLQVADLGEQVQRRGMLWHHLPIVDVQPPDARFESAWSIALPALMSVVADGGRVLVHCRGGLGRAGTVAALLLVAHGAQPAEAVRQVRAVRRGAIETQAQEHYVLRSGNLAAH